MFDRKSFFRVLSAIVLVHGVVTATHAAPPSGWVAAGSAPKDYEMGVDKSVTFAGKPSAYVKSTKETPAGFSTLMQSFSAAAYHGKRVRFGAEVRTENVATWAGLWMRVDGRDAHYLAFDNMHDRPISGTTDWKHYDIVLDVSDEATNIAFGVILDGPGIVWTSDLKIEVVDTSTETTGGRKPAVGPTNLDFMN